MNKSTSGELTQGPVLTHVSLTHQLKAHQYKVHNDGCGQIHKLVLDSFSKSGVMASHCNCALRSQIGKRRATYQLL
jgi:hypothetical protein